MVGDRHAVSVAGEVVEDMFRPTERRLGIDDPVIREELAQETLEALRCCEILERTMELQLVLEQQLLEFRTELATEDAAQNADGQEEARGSRDPSGAVECAAAGPQHAVDMGMMPEVLALGVQQAEQADIGPEVLRVACDFEQRG